MGGNILFLSVLCLLIFETTAVNMCTNGSTSSKDTSLNLVREPDVSGCNCSVKLDKPKNIGFVKPTITFEIVQFSGCKYKLVISYKDRNSIMSCSNNNSVFYAINKSDEIKLYLEPTNSQDKTTTFEVRITSTENGNEGPFVLLKCFLEGVDSTTTTYSVSSNVTYSGSTTSKLTTLTPTSTQVSTSPEVSTSNSSSVSMTGKTPESTKASPEVSTSSSSSVSMTGTTPKSVTSTETQISSKPATGNDMNETKTGGATNPGGDDIDMGIIGGAVGGGLLLIILIIIIIICVVKKRRKKNRENRDYNRPTVTGPQHDYTDIDLGDKGNNSSRQSDNTDQKANSPVEIEIIENDLYVSSDDIMDPKSRDNNNTNQKTDANNGPVEMEIIENDLYVSSGEALNSTSHDNDGPLYAEVNKKPKSRKSDQTDKSNGIAGYTDSDLGAKSNNSSSRQSDNTEQNTNSPVENQKTDANNDLYVSSSEALNSHDNDGPLYSSVNKKPKPPISNHADNSNGITGEDHHDTLL